MYHYVREHDKEFPNFRFLDFDNFKKQLDFFDQEFGFVEFYEWKNFVENGVYPRKKGKVVLTFDDALKCHFNYVFPELKRRSLWGIFYVSTEPYKNDEIMDVHRIHLLCGAFEGKDLYNELINTINDDIIPDSKIPEFRNLTYNKQKNNENVTEFKRILNYFIDYKYRKLIIDKICKNFGLDFNASQFYVENKNLKLMSDNGMVIGSHTLNHPVMSKLSFNEQDKQISESFKYLQDLNIENDKTYCHPYGGFHSFNDDTIYILEKENVKYSFNVEAREIEKDDLKLNKQSLPRFDCNLFKFGQVS